MTGLVDRLIARVRAPLPAVRPVLPSRYEPDADASPPGAPWPAEETLERSVDSPPDAPGAGASGIARTASSGEGRRTPNDLEAARAGTPGPEPAPADAEHAGSGASPGPALMEPEAPRGQADSEGAVERPARTSIRLQGAGAPAPLPGSGSGRRDAPPAAPPNPARRRAGRPPEPGPRSDVLGFLEADAASPGTAADPSLGSGGPDHPAADAARHPLAVEHAAPAGLEGATEVTITIGRIEVRAAPPEPRRRPAARPRVSLDDYLRRAERGAR